MKKILVSLALATTLIATPVLADTATTTPMLGGHPHSYLAGNVDSTHNKGQWCLSNVYPFYRTIFYVAEGTTAGASCNFAQVFAMMNYK